VRAGGSLRQEKEERAWGPSGLEPTRNGPHGPSRNRVWTLEAMPPVPGCVPAHADTYHAGSDLAVVERTGLDITRHQSTRTRDARGATNHGFGRLAALERAGRTPRGSEARGLRREVVQPSKSA
jgi:hypothetical protein